MKSMHLLRAVFSAALLTSATSALAASYYFDSGTGSNLTPGAITWDVGTSLGWATTSSSGTATPIVWTDGNDALFQAGGGMTATLGSNITANSITQNTTNSVTSIVGNSFTLSLTSGSVAVNTTSTGLSFNANVAASTMRFVAGSGTFTGANGVMTTASQVNIGGLAATTLVLDNSGTSVDRIPNSANVTLGSTTTLSSLTIIGSGSVASHNEAIGALGISAGANTITVQGGGSGQVQQLSASSFSRQGNATALVRGGSLQTLSSNSTRVSVGGTAGTGLDFVGTSSSAVGTSTSGTVTTYRIVPYLVGDTSQSGNGSNFLTYDAGTGSNAGLRLLGTGEATILTAGYVNPATVENGRTTGNVTFSTTGTVRLNSLLTNSVVNGSGGVLAIDSGAILNNTGALTIGSGFSKLLLGDGTWNEGIVTIATSGQSAAINTPIDVTGGGGLTKAGLGNVNIGATPLYTGTTNINQGLVRIGAGVDFGSSALVSMNGGTMEVQSTGTLRSPATIGSAGTITVLSGGVVSGTITSNPTSSSSAVNVIVNGGGNVTGALITIANGTSSPSANATAVVSTGNVRIDNGATVSNIINNGQVTFNPLGTSDTTVSLMSGTGSVGGILDSGTAGTKSITFANGSAFAYFRPAPAGGVANSVLQVQNSGSTSFRWFGYNNSAAGIANVAFNGGTFDIAQIGQNNSGATLSGTYTVQNNSVVNVAVNNYDHGIWAATSGSLNFTGANMGQTNGAANATGALQISATNQGVVTTSGNLTLGYLGASSVQTNSVTVNNGGVVRVNGNLLVGTSQTATSETNSVNLNTGGTLIVSGSSVNGFNALVTGAGQTRVFNWNGGTLAAAQIHTGTSAANFNGTLSGAGGIGGGLQKLVNNGGTLAVGGIGIAGRTQVTGSYEGAGTIAIDLSGTVQANRFEIGSGFFDRFEVMGATNTMNITQSDLVLSLANGFNPVGFTFNILATPNNTSGMVSGTFASTNSGSLTNDLGTFTYSVNYGSQIISVSNFVIPEPATFGLLLGGVGMLAVRRRRR